MGNENRDRKDFYLVVVKNNGNDRYYSLWNEFKFEKYDDAEDYINTEIAELIARGTSKDAEFIIVKVIK